MRNIILVGFNYNVSEVDNDEYSNMLEKEVKDFSSNKKAFTDDYAPVEKFGI